MKNKEWFIDYLRATTPTKLPIERERLKEEYGAIIKNKKGRNRFFFLFFSFSLVRNKKKREKKRKKKIWSDYKKEKSVNDLRPLRQNLTRQIIHSSGSTRGHTYSTHTQSSDVTNIFFFSFLSRLLSFMNM